MVTMEQAASEFLAKKRIAVTGVSRTPKGHGSNIVYQRLRDRGYQVFAINPNANQVEGDLPPRCEVGARRRRSGRDRHQA